VGRCRCHRRRGRHARKRTKADRQCGDPQVHEIQKSSPFTHCRRRPRRRPAKGHREVTTHAGRCSGIGGIAHAHTRPLGDKLGSRVALKYTAIYSPDRKIKKIHILKRAQPRSLRTRPIAPALTSPPPSCTQRPRRGALRGRARFGFRDPPPIHPHKAASVGGDPRRGGSPRPRA